MGEKPWTDEKSCAVCSVKTSFRENSIKPQVSGRLIAVIIHSQLKVLHAMHAVHVSAWNVIEIDYISSAEPELLIIIFKRQ